MAPRSSWKGFLKLSLVSVPVKAFTANETSEEIHLNQLHAECNNRVRYKKVCPEHGELRSEEIVSGYEYAKDQYVVIDPDELQKLRLESDKAVGIEGFIKPEEIDPLYFSGRTYYLMPDGPAGSRPYALLHKGMLDAGVVALAKVVMSGRTQLVLVRPVGRLLSMSVLIYAKRVRDSVSLEDELQPLELNPEEDKLTQILISASRIEDFGLDRYTDKYTDELNRLIKMKIDGEEVVAAPDAEEPKILNLMDALKKSVAEVQSASGKKMARSSGAAAAKKTDEKKTG
jgi:DNA end-binding protein Ku